MLHFYSWYFKLKNGTPLLWKSFSFFGKFVSKLNFQSFQWLSHKSISISQTEGYFNTIQDGSFWGCSRMGAKTPPLPKICHTYPTMMKLSTVMLYQGRLKKYMIHVTHPLSCADISLFSSEISKFLYIWKSRYRLYFGT